MLRKALLSTAVLLSHCLSAQGTQPAKVVVFDQPGFPAIDSPAIPREVLAQALGKAATFADIGRLRAPETLQGASLLVMPYGSAFPLADWSAILAYLDGGGNLLLIGGQAMRVPVVGDGSVAFTRQQPQDTYSRQIGILHTYAPSAGGRAGALCLAPRLRIPSGDPASAGASVCRGGPAEWPRLPGRRGRNSHGFSGHGGRPWRQHAHAGLPCVAAVRDQISGQAPPCNGAVEIGEEFNACREC